MQLVRRILSLAGILLLLSSVEVIAQSSTTELKSKITFDRIQLPGGWAGNGILDIAQDTSGFIWFASWNGLYKYDGYEITLYQHDSSDSTSIPENWVEAVYVDRQGAIWTGTYNGGLSRFDPITETFENFLPDPDDPRSLSHYMVNNIHEDNEGNFWIGTQGGGLNLMDRESGTFTHFRHNPDDLTSLSGSQVRTIFEDSVGNLWVGTQRGGLNRMDRESGTFVRYQHDPFETQSLTDNYVNTVYEDRNGNLWIGTRGDGLHTLNRDSNKIIRHSYDRAVANTPGTPRLIHDEINDPTFAGVHFIHEDGKGNLWIGGYQIGIDYYDRQTGVKLHFENDPNHLHGPRTNHFWTFFESKDGTFWLGTFEGLYRITVSPTTYIASDLFNGSHAISVLMQFTKILEDGSGWPAELVSIITTEPRMHC